MVTSFKLDTWYHFKSEHHRNRFLNNNPSYGRFAAIVELDKFKFTEFLNTSKHFKNKNILVDIMVVMSENDNSRRDDRICAVSDSMFEYIEVYHE